MKCDCGCGAKLADQPYQETWDLSLKENGYCCMPDLPDEFRALQAINHLQFRALSVGRNGGQVAIIPLDESSKERGRLIACAPEMARMLLSMVAHVSHGGPTRAEAEVLLKKAGVL
jgi:hypothetical protein